MLQPLEGSPILRGKDAVNFLLKMEENLHKKVDKATIERIRANAKKLRSMMKPNENDCPYCGKGGL